MNIIETQHLTKSYKNFTAVSDLNLHIRKGTVYGFLGPNGAGKSTTMKMFLGLTKPTHGTFSIQGKQYPKERISILKDIGSFIESPAFYGNLTGEENLDLIRRILGLPKSSVPEVLELVGLERFGKRLAKQYSLGMKQRLGIANAILHDPELLILDEPTNGLDPIGISEMRDFMKKLSTQQGKTILISSHILSEISLLADDVGILDHGVLLEESSMKDLEKRNSKYILLEVSDIPKTLLILERKFQVQEYSVQDEHTVQIYDTSLNMGELNTALVLEGITLMNSGLYTQTLEDYFKNITGGEGIA